MSSTWTLKPGVDIVYDGDACTVAEICDGAVVVRTRTGQVRRLRMIDLLRPRAEGGTTRIPGNSRDEDAAPLGVVWADASDAARAVSAERADHVREVLTGYRSGAAEIAREGEPKLAYHPERRIEERIAAKALELGKGRRTVARWVARYKDAGEIGLIDHRKAQPGNLLVNFDDRWVTS